MNDPEQDEYGCVVNSQDTYEALSTWVKIHGYVIFAWTDQDGTQLDILMAYRPLQYGKLQRGMDTLTDLFVAVSDFGMFGFELNEKEKSPRYIGEKLNLGEDNITTQELAKLINGICRLLENQ